MSLSLQAWLDRHRPHPTAPAAPAEDGAGDHLEPVKPVGCPQLGEGETFADWDFIQREQEE